MFTRGIIALASFVSVFALPDISPPPCQVAIAFEDASFAPWSELRLRLQQRDIAVREFALHPASNLEIEDLACGPTRLEVGYKGGVRDTSEWLPLLTLVHDLTSEETKDVTLDLEKLGPMFLDIVDEDGQECGPTYNAILHSPDARNAGQRRRKITESWLLLTEGAHRLCWDSATGYFPIRVDLDGRKLELAADSTDTRCASWTTSQDDFPVHLRVVFPRANSQRVRGAISTNSGERLPPFSVAAMGADGVPRVVATSDSNGSFEVLVGTGPTTVTILDPSGLWRLDPRSRTIDTVPANLEFTAFRDESISAVRGIVLDVDGTPLAGIPMDFGCKCSNGDDTFGSAVTLVDGSFQLGCRVGCEASVQAGGPSTGYYAARVRLDHPSQDAPNVVRLSPMGSVSGKVVDELGDPIEELPLVLINDYQRQVAVATTDRGGKFRFLCGNGRFSIEIDEDRLPPRYEWAYLRLDAPSKASNLISVKGDSTHDLELSFGGKLCVDLPIDDREDSRVLGITLARVEEDPEENSFGIRSVRSIDRQQMQWCSPAIPAGAYRLFLTLDSWRVFPEWNLRHSANQQAGSFGVVQGRRRIVVEKWDSKVGGLRVVIPALDPSADVDVEYKMTEDNGITPEDAEWIQIPRERIEWDTEGQGFGGVSALWIHGVPVGVLHLRACTPQCSESETQWLSPTAVKVLVRTTTTAFLKRD